MVCRLIVPSTRLCRDEAPLALREEILPMWAHGVESETTRGNNWLVRFSGQPWRSRGIEGVEYVPLSLFVRAYSLSPYRGRRIVCRIFSSITGHVRSDILDHHPDRLKNTTGLQIRRLHQSRQSSSSIIPACLERFFVVFHAPAPFPTLKGSLSMEASRVSSESVSSKSDYSLNYSP
jgi:hypothetical protein